MDKGLMIGICLLLLLLGATFKGVPLGVLLNDYQEECFLYETIEVVTEYCDGTLANFTFGNTTEEVCLVYSWVGDSWKNITTIEFTDNCLKYHLVRGGVGE